MERKLTTIFCADVVGYSAMMSADEEGTLRSLSECRSIIDPLIEEFGGRIFGSAGDSVLAEFQSAVNAIRFSVKCQYSLYKRNQNNKQSPPMRFRFGIHLGDVVVQGKNLMGDAVNIAARIESMADYGGISMSEVVYKEVKNKILDVSFVDRGKQYFKNIPEAIGIFSIETLGSEKNPNVQIEHDKTVQKLDATGVSNEASTADVIKAILNDKASAAVSFAVADRLKNTMDSSSAVKVFLARTVVHKDFSSFEELIKMSINNTIPEHQKRAVAGVFEAGARLLLKPELQFKIGKLFNDGYFGEDKIPLAIHVWKISASKHEETEAELGLLLIKSSRKEDIENGIYHLENQARRKNMKCLVSLGNYYFEKKDYENAFHWFWVARKYKDISAQLALEVISKNITKAQFENYKINADALADEIDWRCKTIQ